MTVSPPGFVVGPPRVWLRVEGLAVLAFSAWLYARGGYSWGLFALLFLAPDLSFLAYLGGARVGAAAYNAVHSYVGPLALAAWTLASEQPYMVVESRACFSRCLAENSFISRKASRPLRS
jgi:hypothetical protein